MITKNHINGWRKEWEVSGCCSSGVSLLIEQIALSLCLNFPPAVRCSKNNTLGVLGSSCKTFLWRNHGEGSGKLCWYIAVNPITHMLSGNRCSRTGWSLCVTWLGAEKSILKCYPPVPVSQQKTGRTPGFQTILQHPCPFQSLFGTHTDSAHSPWMPWMQGISHQHLPRKIGNVGLTRPQSQGNPKLTPPWGVLRACNGFCLCPASTQRQWEGNQLHSKSCSVSEVLSEHPAYTTHLSHR